MQSQHRQEIDSRRVAALLRDRGWSGVTAIARIGHGEWSQAFSFRVEPGTEYVVRFSPLDEDFHKDQLASAFAAPTLPIPTVLAFGEAFDGYYAIAQRASGTYLDALDGEQLVRALPSLFSALEGMRQADVSATRGYGVWDAKGNAPQPTWRDALLAIGSEAGSPRIAGWRRRLEQSPTGVVPFETASRKLSELVDEVPNARHLVHADLLNYNVLVEGNHVSAVLDWGSAMYGDWVFDIAWFAFWQPWYPTWASIDFEREARLHFERVGLDVPDFAIRMRCCQIAIGLDNQAYCAFKGESRWPQLAAVARRTLVLSQ
ncbi:MAG: aminoglycoside phosphotransferase family protein [Chloroflexota bacterium]|nr:aminoglycoside phosphotransferase family protein [Chloroflexota bacterium]